MHLDGDVDELLAKYIFEVREELFHVVANFQEVLMRNF